MTICKNSSVDLLYSIWNSIFASKSWLFVCWQLVFEMLTLLSGFYPGRVTTCKPTITTNNGWRGTFTCWSHSGDSKRKRTFNIYSTNFNPCNVGRRYVIDRWRWKPWWSVMYQWEKAQTNSPFNFDRASDKTQKTNIDGRKKHGRL